MFPALHPALLYAAACEDSGLAPADQAGVTGYGAWQLTFLSCPVILQHSEEVKPFQLRVLNLGTIDTLGLITFMGHGQRIFSSILGLYPPDASNTPLPTTCGHQKYLQTLPRAPWVVE